MLFNELIHAEEISGLLLISLDQSIHSDAERELVSQIKARIQNIVCVEWEFDGLPSINLNRQFLERGLTPALKEPLPGATMRDGSEVCDAVIARGKLPEAFLGGTDEVCMGILSSLHRNGVNVPKDCAVIGIDNIEMSQFTSPPLTTVNVDTYEMGRIAVETLLNRAANRAACPPPRSCRPNW